MDLDLKGNSVNQIMSKVKLSRAQLFQRQLKDKYGDEYKDRFGLILSSNEEAVMSNPLYCDEVGKERRKHAPDQGQMPEKVQYVRNSYAE